MSNVELKCQKYSLVTYIKNLQQVPQNVPWPVMIFRHDIAHEEEAFHKWNNR